MLNDNGPPKRGHECLISRTVSARNKDDTADLVSSQSRNNFDYAQLKKDAPSLVVAAAHAAIPSWTNMVLMVSLIFGGCCANVRDSEL
jgi:UDP-xylose/UDP-N-acetylglucosamine transporter B4